MRYVVYVLCSLKDGSTYTGLTSDLNRRLAEHAAGSTKSTKGHRPYRLVYTETHADRKNARRREKYLKSGAGREFIRTYSEVAQR